MIFCKQIIFSMDDNKHLSSKSFSNHLLLNLWAQMGWSRNINHLQVRERLIIHLMIRLLKKQHLILWPFKKADDYKTFSMPNVSSDTSLCEAIAPVFIDEILDNAPQYVSLVNTLVIIWFCAIYLGRKRRTIYLSLGVKF